MIHFYNLLPTTYLKRRDGDGEHQRMGRLDLTNHKTKTKTKTKTKANTKTTTKT